MNIVTGSVATAMKMAELLSMGGPFLHQETNQSPALYEKQLLQMVLPWLGTEGLYHIVCDMHGVSKANVCIPVFISDMMVRVYQQAMQM